MATNGHGHEELGVLPPNALDTRTTGENNNNNNNQPFNIRNDLFYKATLWYARIFPRCLRRLIEIVFLLKAVLSFFVLIYVHMNFIQMPANCLDHVKDVWPKDGIIRVEITRSLQRRHAEQIGVINELFPVKKPYEYEQRKRLNTIEENVLLFTKNYSPENKEEVYIEPSTEELVENKFRETNTPKPTLFNYLSFTNYIIFEDFKEMLSSNFKTNHHTTSKSNFSIVKDSAQFNSTKYPNSSIKSVLEINSLRQSTSIKLPSIDSHKVIYYENFIVEYSLEFGFLHLSPSARNRLGIPVILVTLEPTQNECFGDSVSQFFLEYFLGYDELLRSSFKSLAENEQNKGFLRNIITGEYYKVDSIWMARTSYIASFFIMVVFTGLISMLLRYSQREIIVYMVDFLHLLYFQGTLYFPAMSLMTAWPALIGMEAIMSKTFNNATTAFYIILIVWAADRYDAVCSHCLITKRHWFKFFYLYHFTFYAYHFRFNGQLSNLALISSWFFIQHSMIYFYHHHDLPYVLQQAQL